jgi:hypothetical protein
MPGRNNDKINCPTNLTSPRLYALLLSAVDAKGTVKSQDARVNVFPKARAAAGRYNADNPDTHGESTLAQYGLIEYVDDERTEFKVSHLGKRLLEVFTKGEDGKYNVKPDAVYSFNAIMTDCLCSWKDSSGHSMIFPGMLLVNLLSDKRLGEYLEEADWAYVCSKSNYRNDGDYEKLVSELIGFRNGDGEVEIANTYVFLVSFSGDWQLFDKSTVDGKNRWVLKDITKDNFATRIRDYDLMVNSSNSVLNKDEESTDENNSEKTSSQIKRIIKPFRIPDSLVITENTNNIQLEVEYVDRQGILNGDKVIFVNEVVDRLRTYNVFLVNDMLRNDGEYDINIEKEKRVNREKEQFIIHQMKEEEELYGRNR